MILDTLGLWLILDTFSFFLGGFRPFELFLDLFLDEFRQLLGGLHGRFFFPIAVFGKAKGT